MALKIMNTFRTLAAASGVLLVAGAIGGSEMHISEPMSGTQIAYALAGVAIAVAAVLGYRNER